MGKSTVRLSLTDEVYTMADYQLLHIVRHVHVHMDCRPEAGMDWSWSIDFQSSHLRCDAVLRMAKDGQGNTESVTGGQ